jgi:gluconokinase
MGPSGAGKSVIGEALATRLAERFPGLDFIDSDDLHPAANVEKMRAGIALEDQDRWPWLARVDATFVELIVQADELGDRVSDRPGHFMPATLLASQLGALEHLEDDESGIRVENTGPIDEVVTRVIAALSADW